MRKLFLFVFCVAAAASAAGSPREGARRSTVVLLPLDNFSGVQKAPQEVSALLIKGIEKKGWSVVAGESVEAILEKERIRYVDALEKPLIDKVVAATGASAIVSGTVYTFGEGRNPMAAVSARMAGPDGALLWSDIASRSADDTEGVLGFGRRGAISGVAGETIDALMRDFPAPGQRSAPVRGPSKPLFRAGVVFYLARDLERSKLRVCVLPFDNLSGSPDASRVVADVLALRLAATDEFDVVDPATLRAAALASRIGSFRGIGSDDLVHLADAVGTPLFLRGSIYKYADPAARPGSEPEVQIELSLVDVRAGRVLWAAQHARKGRDYIGFLMLGNVTSAVALADRVIAEIIDSEVHAARSQPAVRRKGDNDHASIHSPCAGSDLRARRNATCRGDGQQSRRAGDSQR
jgi:TolB-like protein